MPRSAAPCSRAKDGVWGLPEEMLRSVPGYGPDVEKNRDEARAIMKKLGYGPDKRLKIKVATRSISLYKDPAVILLGQLKEIYVDAELEIIDTSQWFTRVARKDYSVGLNTTGNGVDDPDQNFFENFSCKSERNYTGYCNPELDKLFEAQSAEPDLDKRKKMVWEIDRKLLEDGARPIIMWNRAAICCSPTSRATCRAGQQCLQRLPLRGRLARPLTSRLKSLPSHGGGYGRGKLQ